MTCQNTLQSIVPPSIVYYHLKGRPAESQRAKYDELSFSKDNITFVIIELQIKVKNPLGWQIGL